MAPEPAGEKQPVRVNIFNQSFTILTADDPAQVEQLAHTVDELMRQYARAGNVDATRAAVLACLHLADQLNNLQQRVDSKTREFTVLLDQVIE